MSKVLRILKRCGKCGRERLYRLRARRCKFTDEVDKGFVHQYLCYGELAAVTKLKPARKSPQEVAAKKMEHARTEVTKKMRSMRRLATSLKMWEDRARRYAVLALKTDEELASEKAKRIEAQERRRAARVMRGIALGGLT